MLCVSAAAQEFQKQEDDYKKQVCLIGMDVCVTRHLSSKQIATLDAKTKDQSIGQVSRNKAVQELAQLKGQDPLPLRRAKITQEAAVRKVCLS